MSVQNFEVLYSIVLYSFAVGTSRHKRHCGQPQVQIHAIPEFQRSGAFPARTSAGMMLLRASPWSLLKNPARPESPAVMHRCLVPTRQIQNEMPMDAALKSGSWHSWASSPGRCDKDIYVSHLVGNSNITCFFNCFSTF